MLTLLAGPELVGLGSCLIQPSSSLTWLEVSEPVLGVVSPELPRPRNPNSRNGWFRPLKSTGVLISSSKVPTAESVSESWSRPGLPRFPPRTAATGFRRWKTPFLLLGWINVSFSRFWFETTMQNLGLYSRYLLGSQGASMRRRPQKLLCCPVSLPHLNRLLLLARILLICSASSLPGLMLELVPLSVRYFSFFFTKGMMEVLRSWNFWFLLMIKLKMTKCRASTIPRSRRSIVSSCTDSDNQEQLGNNTGGLVDSSWK